MSAGAAGSAAQIADYLAALLGPARPRRLARMLDPGGDKYRDVARHVPLDQQKLLAHAAGRDTWAATLDQQGCSRAGVIEIDQGGQAAIMATLGAAQRLGLTCYAIAVDNPLNGHSGGAVWFVYAQPSPIADIRAQLAAVVALAGLSAHTEIWPSGQVIRLPLGYHRWAKTRGQLLDQADRRIDLDSDLAGGLDLIRRLTPNAPPPMLANDSLLADRAAQTADKEHYAKSSGHVQTPPAAVAKRMPSAPAAVGRIDTRAIVAEARARFNAAHAWPELLDQYGGRETRDGWACACGYPHTHDTQLIITSQGKLISFSPNCRWAPVGGSGRALDQFGFYCDRAHGGDYRAAIEAAARQYGLWVEPQRAAPPPPEPEARFSDDQRHAYNAARTHARHDATRRDLDAIYDGACTLDMPDRAHLLFAYLHTRCYERGRLQIAPINDQIASDLDMCVRYVQYAFRELESAGLGRRQGGRNVEGNEAATWTFYRTPNLGCKPQQDAECTLSYKEHDLMLESLELVSRAPAPPIERVCDPEPPALVEPDRVEQAAPAPPPAFDDSDQAACASYTPIEPPSHTPYTGRDKHALSTAARYLLSLESMRERPEADASDQVDQPEQQLRDQNAAPWRPKPRQPRDTPRALDRYVVELARMKDTELAGELKKQLRTLAKFDGQYWLDRPGGPRDKLSLVEHEIDARGSGPAPIRPRSQAHTGPPARQAVFDGL